MEQVRVFDEFFESQPGSKIICAQTCSICEYEDISQWVVKRSPVDSW